jgi:hypothetical protein
MKPRSSSALLIAVLANPTLAGSFDDAQWSELIKTARSANLLGALAEQMVASNVVAKPHPTRHLDGARQLSIRQRQSVNWEIHQLQAALADLQVPVLLLKGAAYVMSHDLVAEGRLFGDIDILVPKASLEAVENRLMIHGWISAKTNAYDQRYYRQWMHEIPPMSHIRRGTVIDVHHTILPPTARHQPDPMQIIARSTAVAGQALGALRVPCPEDLVIHSITHLVHEGELHNGLRDLRDIDCMLRNHSMVPGFWTRLSEYAMGNDLAQPVLLGLHLARRIFKTPIPESIFVHLSEAENVRPPSRWLISTYVNALPPKQYDKSSAGADFSRWMIYVRSHSLRMPPLLLTRHLATKAWMGWREAWSKDDNN